MRRRQAADIEEQPGMNQIIPDGRDASEPRLRVRLGIGKAVRVVSATLLCVSVLSAPDLAYAAHGGGGGGGGGFHGGGGGFHGGAGGGGFHGGGLTGGFHSGSLGGFHGRSPGAFHAGGLGGFPAGGFSGRGIHPGALPGARTGRFAGGSPERAGGNSIVLRGGEHTGHWQRGWRNGRYGWSWGYDPYLWSSDGAYDDSYSDGQPDVAQSGYYCPDPAGYYPDITQCSTAWQIVPGG
jgi:hypothetical protein